jgi:hypothetical protein
MTFLPFKASIYRLSVQEYNIRNRAQSYFQILDLALYPV